MSWRAFSLKGRVALASAAAAALGGSVAALSAGVAARELISAHEASALRDAAHEVVDELNEEREEGDEDDDAERDAPATSSPRTLEQMLAHELDDLKLPSARAVIRDGQRALAGDASLPAVPLGECRLEQRAGTPLRACSVRFGQRRLTLAVEAAAERRRGALIARALWIGVLSGALLGGLFSFLVSRWALAPLSELRDHVRAVRPDQPSAGGLSGALPQPELEELRAAIANLVQRLSEALSHAQAFAAEAAHELRTPLTVIAGELELLSGGERDDALALARVQRQVSELISLVQRLLVLARPAQLEPTAGELVDMGDVLAQVRATLPPEAQQRLHALVADDVVVRGDPALLRAMLANALENALKFSSGAVELTIAGASGEAQIDLVDSGPGIAAEERERVFAPFYRSRAARAGRAEGHGLGLALIARVAQAHAGAALFLPAVRGAHLRIRLPLWTPATRAR